MDLPPALSATARVTELPVTVAVELGHALVERAARRRGVRVLFLKGPAAQHQGLRRPQQSGDVDVFPEPHGLGLLAEELQAEGWQVRPDEDPLALFPHHALTLFHPQWPIDIDLHHRVPGMEAPAAEAFEYLFNSRVELEAAGRKISVPSRSDHALVLALNALRTPWDTRSTRALEHLVSSLTGDDWVEFWETATHCRATGAVAPFVNDAPSGLSVEAESPSLEWSLYTHQVEPTALWLDALRRAPWRSRPMILRHAVAPTRAAMSKRDLRMLSATTPELLRAHVARWGKLLRSLPAVARTYRDLQGDRRGGE